MNNWFLVLGVSLIFIVLLPLTFESMYNYYNYSIPIKNSEIDPHVIHTDLIHIENEFLAGTMTNIDLLEDDSIHIKFDGSQEFPWGYEPPFTFEHTFKKGDSFLILCNDSEKDDDGRTYFSLFEYAGIVQKNGTILLSMIHADGTSNSLDCNFPQVIEYSINAVSLQPVLSNKTSIEPINHS